jgi:hypothetical protein
LKNDPNDIGGFLKHKFIGCFMVCYVGGYFQGSSQPLMGALRA